MEYATLINRTSKTLKGTWDGKHYNITPGQHAFPMIMAEAFRRQNPVMGSEDPRTLQCDYLLAIEAHGDNTSPIEQSAAVERWDRSKLPNSQVVEVIRGNGLFSQATEGSKPFTVGGAIESGFSKP